MTINYAREMVIDFTKPFMNLGISILFKVSGSSFFIRSICFFLNDPNTLAIMFIDQIEMRLSITAGLRPITVNITSPPKKRESNIYTFVVFYSTGNVLIKGYGIWDVGNRSVMSPVFGRRRCKTRVLLNTGQ